MTVIDDYLDLTLVHTIVLFSDILHTQNEDYQRRDYPFLNDWVASFLNIFA